MRKAGSHNLREPERLITTDWEATEDVIGSLQSLYTSSVVIYLSNMMRQWSRYGDRYIHYVTVVAYISVPYSTSSRMSATLLDSVTAMILR